MAVGGAALWSAAGDMYAGPRSHHLPCCADCCYTHSTLTGGVIGFHGSPFYSSLPCNEISYLLSS